MGRVRSYKQGSVIKIQKMNPQNKKIHLTGIKGVGMTPLAIIAKEGGFEVSGSDFPDKFITDEELEKAGIKAFIGFSEENVKDAYLVITTAAHGGLDNLEVKYALKNKIKVLTQAEALGQFQKGEIFGKDFIGISVAGSHGKTTTSAIVSTLLSTSGLDPTYAIGTGNIPSLGLSGHFGSGKYFVAEGDEYFTDLTYKRIPKFYYQSPKYLIITNIDYDHVDVYSSIDEVYEVFLKFANKLEKSAVVIICGDGEQNRKFIKNYKGKTITYGKDSTNDYVLKNVKISAGNMTFSVKTHKSEDEFEMNIFGEQNALNSLSAIILGYEIGLKKDEIKNGIAEFKGTKRRQEFIGKTKEGSLIYDDYAHHPEEIEKTLLSFRENFPDQKIVVVFQPHMYSRTIKLFDNFAKAFTDSDEVLMLEVFPSFREKGNFNFSSKKLAEEVEKTGKKSLYFPNLTDVIKYLSSENYQTPTIILTMGAGDVYKVSEELVRA